ncbi:glycosyltransferase family 4 protein [Helicobacter labacensis]|uniref:glycosyltransferase family 4 protein n=1 Tax=Helicobacter labacensis TaxID=2316079 RepID=UPI001F3A76AC|nr:glycosyltransferase family 1 protein [Helicobacter labacensis]
MSSYIGGRGVNFMKTSRNYNKPDLSLSLSLSLSLLSSKNPYRRWLLTGVKTIFGEKLYIHLKHRFLLRWMVWRVSEPFDLYIEPGGQYAPKVKATQILGCIHDIPICDPTGWALLDSYLVVWKYQMFPQMQRYTEAICFSKVIKKDILKTFGWSSSRVHLIYHGLRDYLETPLEGLPPSITKDFILVVGAKARRRNVGRLIEAFKLLPTHLQETHQIVLVGAPIDLLKEDVFAHQQPFVQNLHYVKDALLKTLYARAKLLWWGSTAEGFGLPMLEAMQAGCVVLASDVSCMPEILGDSGIYCNPYNVTDIANALEQALIDETLRAECRIRGLERVKSFSFEASMAKHIEVVEGMLGAFRDPSHLA